jgi:TonB family protein
MRTEHPPQFIASLLVSWLLFVFSASYVCGQDAPSSTPPEHIQLIPRRNPALMTAEAQQWHLKASFRTFDEQGNVEDRGTFEEYWAAPNKSKAILASTAFHKTDYGTDKGGFQTGDHGTPPPKIARVQEAVLDSWSGRDHPVEGLFAPPFNFTYSHPILYLGKPLPSDIEGMIDGKVVVAVHIESIEPLTAEDTAHLDPPPDATPVLNPADAKKLIATHTTPIYPPIARAARVQGLVVLNGLIGKDGHVENLEVTSGPPMLRQAALDCVRNWTYRPFLLNALPAEFETTINIVFTLGLPTQ